MVLKAFPANAVESPEVESLLSSLRLDTQRPGSPKRQLKILEGDKAFDSRALREALRRRGIQPRFLHKRSPGKRRTPGRPLGRMRVRWNVERCFSWLQRKFRRLVVRWERQPQVFQAFLTLALLRLWVPILG